MTLMYKLFGYPGNFDEFVDKAKRKNLQVEVKCWCSISVEDQASTLYSHVIQLQAGRDSYNYFKTYSSELGSHFPKMDETIEIRDLTLKKGKEVADILRNNSIEAKLVNSYDLSNPPRGFIM